MTGRNAAKSILILCGFFAALPTLAANAMVKPTSVPVLLQRMSHALTTLNYEGTFVYSHSGRLEAMHIVHRADGHGSEERLTSLTGPLHEVIRRQNTVVRIMPGRQLIVVGKHHANSHWPMIRPAAADTEHLEHYYLFRRHGNQRVAGRDCLFITVKPKDQYRYGYRLWLDAKTDLLLRSELISTRGQTIERVMFTGIKTPETIPAKAIAPTVDTTGFTRRSQTRDFVVTETGPQINITVGDLPPGYRLAVSESQRLKGIKVPVRHYIYTDGLASLSVFAAPYKKGKEVLHGPSHRGPVNAYGRVVGGYQVTVVGDVPAKTVEVIAKSIAIEKSNKPQNPTDVTAAATHH